MIKKKFRWLIQFMKDGVAIRDAEFVKISSRPPPPIPYPKSVRFELVLFNLCRPKNWQPEDFNQLKLSLLDGCGNSLEDWLLKDVKFYAIQFAYDDEAEEGMDVLQCEMTFGPDMEYKSNSELFKDAMGEK